MARKKIREHDGKRLVKQHAKHIKLDNIKSVIVDKHTDWVALEKANTWLKEQKLVAKPDMMFGKRGKHNLVLLDATLEQAQSFVADWFAEGKTVTIEGVTGPITHFLIEPFVPHQEEYYLSITSNRLDTEVCFSTQGGVNIEENWNEKVQTVSLPSTHALDSELNNNALEQLLVNVPAELKQTTTNYVRCMLFVFEELDFICLESNPFVFVEDGDTKQPIPLDLVVEVDDTAKFKCTRKWGDLEFPDVFGHTPLPEEAFIERMDAKTGASLKLTVLNPTGRIWNLVAGGGASVIFADTVADLGFGSILGNYGEYSGAPNEEETYHYARTLLDLATRNIKSTPNEQEGRVLLIGGGIANFTDVAKTFKGIVHALKEYKEKLIASKMRIYVRRAGPNYQQGLKLIEQTCSSLGLWIKVFGPERHMTDIIPMAIDYIKETTIETKQ